jgi:hypothetical protein
MELADKESLLKILAECTVCINVKGSQKTGFFVAPGLILTCKHVIEDALNSHFPIDATWKEMKVSVSLYALPKSDNLDLALLEGSFLKHPCVLLYADTNIGSDLFSYSYRDGDPRGEASRFLSEGWTSEAKELLKIKVGEFFPGLNGSPALNLETGCVCGIVQSGESTPFPENWWSSNRVISTNVILQVFQELNQSQRQFHEQDRRWINCLTSEQLEKIKLNWEPFVEQINTNTEESELGPKVGLSTDISDTKAVPVAAKQIASQKAGLSAEALRIILAISLSFNLIGLFEILVYGLQWHWLIDHPNSYSLQASFDFLLIICVVGCLFPKLRPWCFGTAGITIFGVLLQVLGGPKSTVK